MDQSRAVYSPPSLQGGGGGDNGNRDDTRHSRLNTTESTYYSDTKRTSSTNTSSYELSETAWRLSDAPNATTNPAFSLPPRKVVTKKNRWTPISLKARAAIPMVVLMLAIAAAIEVAYAFSWKMNGYSVSPLDKFGSPQFFASFLPVLFILPFVFYCLTVTHEVHRLQPYISASHGNAPPQQTVLVSYVNQNRLFAALRALKNGHRLVVVTTVLTYVSALWQPLAAALFVVRPTNHIVGDFSPVVVTQELGVNPTFTDLDAFLAAAGYTEAAVVHGLDDPPFVRGGWTVAPFDFPPQPKNATMTLDAQAVFVDTHCETLSPQLNRTADGSYDVTATRGSCVYGFRANTKDGDDAFGVSKLDNCSPNVEDRFKPVVFWFFTFDGPTASMVHCAPTIETHLVNVNVSLSTHLINTEPTKIKELTSNVTVGAPFNGLALNGLFFPNQTNIFIAARGIAVLSAIPNAIHKDAASNPRGMASSLRDISGQLNRVKKIYSQYLTIAAKSNFFVPKSSTVTPVVETWMPRFWMDKLATHVLATLLITSAVAMAILQYVHRKDRNRLYLAGPPGSIASDVSLTSSAKFGLLLNAGDTEMDMERKLQGMRFGIEHSTGQIIVEREDGNRLARYVEEDRRRAREDLKYHRGDDVRASLLANEKGRDSFVGLRAQDPESQVKNGSRQSVVGSIAPLLGSPSPSASFSQTKFSPSPQTVVFSPPPSGPPTASSPLASSTAQRFAPLGPPPQPQDRNSYFEPYVPNPS